MEIRLSRAQCAGRISANNDRDNVPFVAKRTEKKREKCDVRAFFAQHLYHTYDIHAEEWTV